MEFKSTKDRLYYFLEQVGVSQPEFQKKTGLSNSYVSTMGDSPNQKTRDAITGAYEDLNIDWLITGKGKMLHSQPDEPSPAEQALEALLAASNKIKSLEARITALEKIKSQLNPDEDKDRRNALFDSAIAKVRDSKSGGKEQGQEEVPGKKKQ